jgi:hypothetical protein
MVGEDAIWESPGIGVMLLPSLYTPHPGVNATIAPSGLSMTQSHIYLRRCRTVPTHIAHQSAVSPCLPGTTPGAIPVYTTAGRS